MKKTILLVVFLVLAAALQPFVVMNDIVPAFPSQDREKIEDAVVVGTVHFLEGKAYADLLLMEYEKSARQVMNHSLAYDYADKAEAALQTAKNSYRESIALGSRAGYAAENILKLKNFGYDQFALGKNLEQGVMAKAASFLSSGDILGAYRENVENIDAILVTLQLIKDKLGGEETPGIETFWTLLQQFSSAALFGNYCTMTATAALK